jgi:acyl carrier protein
VDQAQIENELRHIIAQVVGAGLVGEDIPRGPGLLDQLHIDSLIALQIIVQIEQQFNVTIDDDEFALEMLDSLDEAIAYVEQASDRHLLADEN